MIAPINNVVINNDVAPSHRLRRMDSMSSIEISKVSNSGRSIPKILKYRDTTKYRYRTFASIAILRYFWYRTSTSLNTVIFYQTFFQINILFLHAVFGHILQKRAQDFSVQWVRHKVACCDNPWDIVNYDWVLPREVEIVFDWPDLS